MHNRKTSRGKTHPPLPPVVEIAVPEGMPEEREIKLVQTIVREITNGLSIEPDNICVVVSPFQTLKKVTIAQRLIFFSRRVSVLS